MITILAIVDMDIYNKELSQYNANVNSIEKFTDEINIKYIIYDIFTTHLLSCINIH